MIGHEITHAVDGEPSSLDRSQGITGDASSFIKGDRPITPRLWLDRHWSNGWMKTIDLRTANRRPPI